MNIPPPLSIIGNTTISLREAKGLPAVRISLREAKGLSAVVIITTADKPLASRKLSLFHC